MNNVAIIQIEASPDVVAKITLMAMQESVNYRCESMNRDIYDEKYKEIVTQRKMCKSVIKGKGK